MTGILFSRKSLTSDLCLPTGTGDHIDGFESDRNPATQDPMTNPRLPTALAKLIAIPIPTLYPPESPLPIFGRLFPLPLPYHLSQGFLVGA